MVARHPLYRLTSGYEDKFSTLNKSQFHLKYWRQHHGNEIKLRATNFKEQISGQFMLYFKVFFYKNLVTLIRRNSERNFLRLTTIRYLLMHFWVTLRRRTIWKVWNGKVENFENLVFINISWFVKNLISVVWKVTIRLIFLNTVTTVR